MIPVYDLSVQTPDTSPKDIAAPAWQREIGNALKTPAEILAYLNIDGNTLPYEVEHQSPFAARITKAFADLIDPTDPYDPILLQFLPIKAERQTVHGFQLDALDEAAFAASPSLIKKYSNRALLIAHQACAVHCRYCFRRHFPYEQHRLTGNALQQALDVIQSDPAITEIILSGGDPFSLSDGKLGNLLEQLNSMAQLTTIRFHTRTLVTTPSRITETLIENLSKLTKHCVIVFHVNHANELGDAFQKAVAKLSATKITLLNQTVLLKGINDQPDIQVRLAYKLFDLGILPYYLHLLDKVSGTAHFDVDEAAAQALWQAIHGRLPGYLVPRLVREIPERDGKTWMNASDA